MLMPTTAIYSPNLLAAISHKNGSAIPKVAAGRLLRAADKALTPDTIKASWRDTGLWPFDEAFLSAHPSILHRPKPVPAIPQGHIVGSGRLLNAPEFLAAFISAIGQRAAVREEKKRKLVEKPSSTKKLSKRQARVPLGAIDMNRPVYQPSDAPSAAACAVLALRVVAARAIPAFATTALPYAPLPAYVSLSLSCDCHDL